MNHYIPKSNPMYSQYHSMTGYKAQHFDWKVASGVATITLNRPERKNPLTFGVFERIMLINTCIKYPI